MPRLSVTIFLLAACLGGAEAVAQLRPNVIIRRAEQLARDEQVRRFVEPLQAAASGKVVYTQCGKELGITAEQQAYLDAHYDTVARGFMAAFHDTYVGRFAVDPPKELVADYTQYVANTQAAAVNRTTRNIRKNGCRDDKNRRMVKYFDALATRDAVNTPEQAAPLQITVPATEPTTPTTSPAPVVTTPETK